MVRLVVFDMAGTVIDEQNIVYKTVQKAIAQAGHPVSLEVVLELGAGKEKLQAIKDVLAFVTGAAANEAEATAIFSNFKQMLELAYNTEPIALQPGAAQLFAHLQQRGVKVGLNTGYNRETAEHLLRRLNYLGHPDIDVLATASDVQNGRPQPDMIHHIMNAVGINDPKEVVKIGDSKIDIEEGRAAGCIFNIGITTGAQTAQQLNEVAPDAVLNHLDELIPFLINHSQLAAN